MTKVTFQSYDMRIIEQQSGEIKVQGNIIMLIIFSGYYCPQGTANYTDYPCPTGHYCPVSTKNWNQYPCNSGTFNNQTMRTASGDCLSCTGRSTQY